PYEAGLRFKATLSCLYSYVSGSGKNRSRRERLIWQREGYAHSRSHAQGTELEILFDVEEDLPASDPEQRETWHLWRRTVEAELPGVDLLRSFEIPVFPTAERARRLRRLSTAHQEALAERERAISGVMRVRQLPDGVELHFPALRHPGPRLTGIVAGAVF